ncbi:MAG: malate synthase G, partial [Gammaproteobacteria bacterium]|nr:malate synthase G [Gammaproteobacteria bacterium]
MKSCKQDTVHIGGLEIAKPLHDLVNNEIIPGSNVTPEDFWSGLESLVRELGSENKTLLQKRDELQARIDDWHRGNRGKPHDAAAYKAFLQEIGYLEPAVDDFEITTSGVDTEIATIAGPQLVVPLDNARYVLNAANARWGSLYDALYSSDAIPESNGCGKIKKYNPIRGEKVIEVSRDFLDRHFALEKGTHRHTTHYRVADGQVIAHMGDGSETTLLKPQQFTGYAGNAANPDAILLKHHDLHVEIRFGEGYFIGRRDHAHIYDIHVESAITTIMDCEDSVASVDVEDKLKVYGNWLGLMKGTLVRTIEKDGETIERTLAKDRVYTGPDGEPVTMHGRSLLLVRNVGA